MKIIFVFKVHQNKLLLQNFGGYTVKPLFGRTPWLTGWQEGHSGVFLARSLQTSSLSSKDELILIKIQQRYESAQLNYCRKVGIN